MTTPGGPKKKRSAKTKSAAPSEPRAAASEEHPPKRKRDWKETLRAYGLLVLSAALMCLGFAGFGIWPLAFVGMVPALFVFDQDPPASPWAFLRRSLFFGYLAFYGGFYWVVDTIVEFGGFPYLVSLLFASVYFLYQGFQFVVVAFLWRRARLRGWNATASLVAAYVGSELAFPMLFDNFYGNSFHMLPPLIQIADLGGPMLLTALAMAGNGAAYELLRAAIRKEPLPRAVPAVFAAALALTLGYGYWRIAEVEARMAQADRLTLGLVQTNMGIFQKREDPEEGRRRHIEQSLQLERESHPDLLIWPESAATFFIPDSVRNVRRFVLESDDGEAITTPTLFGGLARREVGGRARAYNTAFMTDANGNITGSYDKTYLLAFGEYIPFGDVFPWVYDVSRNTGQFTPGNHVRALRFRDYRISTLICYEDILPRFVRRSVRENDPHLLVNVTNDAWFGETQEPYVHLALAKFRAVEHHRYLVRATNTGISAIIDPTGRVTEQSPLFRRANVVGEVRMMNGWTLYQSVGDWPGWLALGVIVYMAYAGRWRPKERKPAEGEKK
ncbi:MAG: apolipoprotein N-acyltransferase [Sandaracinaceae bacterium]|nr:apolipoprotein N-acyltransferase [Sandaracinaceae bacterium]